MSKRNSLDAKRAARARLRAERERQERRRKVRRQLVVGGSALATLAVVGVVGVALADMNGGGGDDGTDWSAVRDQVDAAADDGGNGDAPRDEAAYPTAPPAHATGEDGLTIRVGDEDAEHTLTLYEDPRCPACASFEQTMGESVRQDIEDGTYQVEYVFGTFLDSSLSGTGSKNALGALGAALDVSTDAFLAYHEALYSLENHPLESNDEFGDDERLIEIAQEIPELRDNQQFEDDVRNSTFAYWALSMSDTFDNDPDVTSTPTLKWDGEVIETPRSVEEFDAMVEENTR
ncbi:thioredoxin domain-containing protein [Streptomyces sp. 4N509B]|uniref:thioredoxin domain-containing protein n=1 Tax=Streptomyces sp. 4N509B TaxID=3457413 RepID=UPI003FD435D6